MLIYQPKFVAEQFSGQFRRLLQQPDVEVDVHAEVRHRNRRFDSIRISAQSGRRLVREFESSDEIFHSFGKVICQDRNIFLLCQIYPKFILDPRFLVAIVHQPSSVYSFITKSV